VGLMQLKLKTFQKIGYISRNPEHNFLHSNIWDKKVKHSGILSKECGDTLK
jgi:hypothetical protein